MSVPKLTIEVSPVTKLRLDITLAEHGSKKAVITALLEDYLDMCDDYGATTVNAGVLSKKMRFVLVEW